MPIYEAGADNVSSFTDEEAQVQKYRMIPF